MFRPCEWSTEVAQINYGHRARKLTWLLYVGANPPPPMDWSTPRRQDVYLCKPGRTKTNPGRDVPIMSARENETTPLPFAHALIDMAANSAPSGPGTIPAP